MTSNPFKIQILMLFAEVTTIKSGRFEKDGEGAIEGA